MNDLSPKDVCHLSCINDVRRFVSFGLFEKSVVSCLCLLSAVSVSAVRVRSWRSSSFCAVQEWPYRRRGRLLLLLSTFPFVHSRW